MEFNKKLVQLSAVLLAIGILSTSIYAATLTLRPNGQGVYSEWTNVGCDTTSEWDCVDESPADTTDYLYSYNNGNAESFEFTDIDANLSSITIYNLKLYYYEKRYNSTNYKIQSLIRINGTDYLQYPYDLNSNWSYKFSTYSTNPATAGAWTVPDINALEAGMKTYTSYYGGYVAQVYALVDYSLIPNSCSDTDSGANYTVQGTVSGYYYDNEYNYTDYCVSNATLMEYLCSGDKSANSIYDCTTNGTTSCYDGACI